MNASALLVSFKIPAALQRQDVRGHGVLVHQPTYIPNEVTYPENIIFRRVNLLP